MAVSEWQAPSFTEAHATSRPGAPIDKERVLDLARRAGAAEMLASAPTGILANATCARNTAEEPPARPAARSEYLPGRSEAAGAIAQAYGQEDDITVLTLCFTGAEVFHA